MEQLLRDKIEDRVGRRINVPRDFAWLSEEIEQRTRQRVSASTLRRFWGYVNEGVTASRYTKDVLAHYLGYADFEEFKRLQCGGNEQSSPLLSEQICSDDLYEGQMLKLTWLPDRTCIVRHDGGGRFTVVRAENTRLAEGDIMECHLFINHEPAYMQVWMQGSSRPVAYVIGKKDGIMAERYSAD